MFDGRLDNFYELSKAAILKTIRQQPPIPYLNPPLTENDWKLVALCFFTMKFQFEFIFSITSAAMVVVRTSHKAPVYVVRAVSDIETGI